MALVFSDKFGQTLLQREIRLVCDASVKKIESLSESLC